MFQLELTESTADLEQIVALQRLNHINAVDEKLWPTEGFVTLEFTVPVLEQMKGNYKHVVARAGNAVIGYALVLLTDHRASFPFLDDMFASIDAALLRDEQVQQKRYFVMGQVCVAKEYRGKGVFNALYRKLKEQMQHDFDLVITEVAEKNTRSVKAHEQIGFVNLLNQTNASTGWRIIVWDWKETS